MGSFLARRLAQFLAVVFGTSLVVFFTLHWVADPIRLLFPIDTPQSVVDNTREQLGLNRPVVVQYFDFLGGALHGDFGHSMWVGGSALRAAVDHLPATVGIVFPATILGVIIGGGLGLVAGMRPGSFFDNALNVVSFTFLAAAEFWLGIMLILLFAVRLRWLPAGGLSSWQSFVLPIAVIATRPFAQTAQLMRSVVRGESVKQYVTTARSKGLTEAGIGIKHILRNAAIPVLTLALYDLSRIFVGTAIVVEVVFSWPGTGRLAVGAVERGDIDLVQAIVIIGATTVAAFNLLADLLYFRLDPRTRVMVRGS